MHKIYYLDGNMKSKTGAQNASYAYDGENRLVTSITFSGEELVQEDYEYDAFNNRTKKTVTQTDGTYVTEYGYTQNNLLDFETFGEYVNDTAQIQNRTNYIYDNRGNLSTKTTLDNTNTVQAQTAYSFDYLNRLSGVTSGDDVYSYAYNGDNLRMSKTINGNTTQYILDGMNVAYEYDTQNTKSYFMGNGLEGYLSGTQRRYYNTEPNGTVYSVYGDDTANYENIGEYTYGGYGDILTDSQIDNPFKFAGEYNDDETGLIYLRNRYYDPTTGRFISEDPAMDGNNWYIYCNNNPINFVDPWGLAMFALTTSKSPDSIAILEQQIRKVTGDYGYYMDGHWLKWKDGEDIVGGSEVARSLISALVNSPDTIFVKFEKGDPHNSNYTNRVATITSVEDSDETSSAMIHEFVHGFTDIYDLDERIIYNFNKDIEIDEVAVKHYVKYQYMEATAITVEQEFRKEMGYLNRESVVNPSTQMIGVNNYGQFPYALTHNPQQVGNINGSSVRIASIVRCAIIHSYGPGIIDYLKINY